MRGIRSSQVRECRRLELSLPRGAFPLCTGTTLLRGPIGVEVRRACSPLPCQPAQSTGSLYADGHSDMQTKSQYGYVGGRVGGKERTREVWRFDVPAVKISISGAGRGASLELLSWYTA